MARAVAAAAITALTAAGLLAAPGAARAECDKGPTFTSRDSGITYVCVNGQYGESGYVQIPGNGVFRVGAEVAPGTYRSAGPDSPGGTCSWSTHRTLGASVSDMVDGNTSTGQLYVVIPSTVAAFESAGCQNLALGQFLTGTPYREPIPFSNYQGSLYVWEKDRAAPRRALAP